nr:GNAT family N-acetyltransferase [Propionibacterium sp.]
MGPEFAAARHAELDERIAHVHADLDAAAAAERAGVPPRRRHLVAHNERGGIVGVGCSGEGIEAWEAEHVGADWFPPASTFALSHLYTVPGTHGTGLGQRLLDALLPGRRPAYLWVFLENPRAIRFYERNGFGLDGLRCDSGESWGARPLGRMVRPSVAG